MAAQADRVVAELTAKGVDVVRVVFPDLMGTERSKELLVEQLPAAVERGVAFCGPCTTPAPLGDNRAGAGRPGTPGCRTWRIVPEPGHPWVVVPVGAGAWRPASATSAAAAESPRGPWLARVVAGLAESGHVAGGRPGAGVLPVACRPGTGFQRPYSPEPGNVYVSGNPRRPPSCT